MQMIQRDLYQQIRQEMISARDHIMGLVRTVDAARLNERPEAKGWSLGQVLEHLCRANDEYERPLLQLLSRSRADAGAASREWSTSFVGGRIATSLLNPKPIRLGPPRFRPGPTPRNGVAEAFHAGELRFLQLMDDGIRYDWKALRISSPALPGWFPKMNIGDGFRIHAIHINRHAGQIQRLVSKL